MNSKKLQSNAPSDSSVKKKLNRQQFRQKILSYCKRYLPDYGLHCAAQSDKSMNDQQRVDTGMSKLDGPEKREIKQQPVNSNPQANFCASYNMYCRRFLLSQPKFSMRNSSNTTDPKPSQTTSQTKSSLEKPLNKTSASTKPPQVLKRTTSVPQPSSTTHRPLISKTTTSTTATNSPPETLPKKESSNLTVQQTTAHLNTPTQDKNVKINVTVEEKPQLKDPRQPKYTGPDSSKNSKNSTSVEDIDRRSSPLVLPPPIPNAASDADTLFKDSPLKSHVKKALDADLAGAAPQAQTQDRPKILPVVVMGGASPSNAAGTVAGLLGKAGGVKDPTCTADCTAPHCTTECKCANTHKTVEAKCNPPSNADLTSMCQAWYEKCQMYKPIQFA
uniref:Uncharacterized protein n=1 Tax=Ditylenchus dipsaci TaxID=166011 RepID=A0A915EAV9_9BILA